jgi:hypothetical protein
VSPGGGIHSVEEGWAVPYTFHQGAITGLLEQSTFDEGNEQNM